MRQFFHTSCLVIIVFLIITNSSFAEPPPSNYPQIYTLYMQLGKEAIDNKKYEKAFNHFQHAHLIDPSAEDPLSYINLLKRIKEGRVNVVSKTQQLGPISKSRHSIISNTLDAFEKKEYATPNIPQKNTIQIPPPTNKFIVPEQEPAMEITPETIYLDDALWSSQPKTLLQIEMQKAVVFEGSNIKRFLIITPNFFEVKTIDRDKILIIANQRGASFLHVWDDRGRWTFNVEVILPFHHESLRIKEKQIEEYSKPFTFSYATDWASFNRGKRMLDLERQSLDFQQRLSFQGETPYGDFDTSAIFEKFSETTDVTRYTVGLTDGHIGKFKDFNIRGFDFLPHFSALSLPRQTVRGIFFNSKAFNQKIEFTYLRGRARNLFPTLSSGSSIDIDNFVEGTRIAFFPDEKSTYAINFARGYGNDRSDFLQKRVFSIESEYDFDNKTNLATEIAYDEHNIAQTINYNFGDEHTKGHIKFRDINKNFTTIKSFPGGRGEVGALLNMNWDLDAMDIDTSLDLYRDRLFQNPDKPRAMNAEFSTNVTIPVSKNDTLRSSLYYINTQQELSPRKSLRLSSNYIKKFPLSEHKYLSTNWLASYQRSRFDQSSSSDYDRFILSGGLNMPLIGNLNYHANYEYSWVDEKVSGEQLTPSVFRTGFDYSRNITDNLMGNLRYTYRDEEDTEGTNSFLSGEDSAIGSLGLTYRYSQDLEFYFNGRVRNIWAESDTREAFDEVDIRLGVRSNWELPFSWSPSGIVEGIVFKDLNGNQKWDEDEEGIEGIEVKIGKHTTITDQYGHYEDKVSAKKVQVGVNPDSIPDGFVFSTPILVDVNITPHIRQKVNHGLSIHSGVYGVVFYDKNNNNKPDQDDEFIPKVKIFLDDAEVTVSDFEGTYFFRDIAPGMHQVRIDVNSIPIEYLPKVKLKKEVEVSEGTTYVFHVPLTKN